MELKGNVFLSLCISIGLTIDGVFAQYNDGPASYGNNPPASYGNGNGNGNAYMGGGSIGGGSIGGGYVGGGSIAMPNLVYPPMPIGYQQEQGYGYGNLFLLSGLLGGFDKAQDFMAKLYSANMPKDAGQGDDYGNNGYNGNNGYGSAGYGSNGGYADTQGSNGYGRNMNDAVQLPDSGQVMTGFRGPNTNFGYRQPPAVPGAPDAPQRRR